MRRWRAHRRQRVWIGQGRGGEARNVEGIERDAAAANCKSRAAGTLCVKARGCGREARLFLRVSPLTREAGDVVVAVSLDVGDAEYARERQILLHGEAALRGGVFPGNKQTPRWRPGAAHRIDE